MLSYSPGDVLLRAGASSGDVIVLRSGRVRLERHDRTGSDALAWIDAVHVFGEGCLLGGGALALSVVADDEVEADVIDASRLRELMDARPAFAIRLLRAIAGALHERVSRLAESAAPPFPPS